MKNVAKALWGAFLCGLVAVGGISPSIAQTAIQGAANVTPRDCSVAITTGGTAQNIIAASPSIHGFTIQNIDSSEPVWISFTTTAAASTIGSFVLATATATTFAGAGSYSSPLGFGTNGNVSVVAATTGHKISCVRW